MASIPKEKWQEVGNLYKIGKPMSVVAKEYGVSIGAVVYVLRRLAIPRRSGTEANRIRFETAPLSFALHPNPDKELEIMGAMLYWAEGYKTDKAYGIDFANSDPDMALVFLRFLRSRYVLDQKRLHFSLYYYSNQNLPEMISYWSKRLSVSSSQFKNHYMKTDPRTSRKKMPYGVVHIKYNDKRLLRNLLNLIESYRSTYCVGGRVVNYTTL